jgi:hypothetical protein
VAFTHANNHRREIYDLLPALDSVALVTREVIPYVQNDPTFRVCDTRWLPGTWRS